MNKQETQCCRASFYVSVATGKAYCMLCGCEVDNMPKRVFSNEKTLRDEFAMAALTGYLANHLNNEDVPTVTEIAYEVADGMLLARNKKEV